MNYTSGLEQYVGTLRIYADFSVHFVCWGVMYIFYVLTLDPALKPLTLNEYRSTIVTPWKASGVCRVSFAHPGCNCSRSCHRTRGMLRLSCTLLVETVYVHHTRGNDIAIHQN